MSQPSSQHQFVENHTVDYVPPAERHGKARDLFTLWFSTNIAPLPIVTGAMVVQVFHLNLLWGLIAIVLGSLIGITAGYDYADRDGTAFSPSLGLVWKPDAAWRLRANTQQAFRRPTLNELYRPFRQGANVTEANPALRTESVTTAEIGVEWTPFGPPTPPSLGATTPPAPGVTP